MKKLCFALMTVGMTCSVQAASSEGVISTDRFGYTGVVQRFDSEQAALSGTPINSTTIGNRDLAIFVAQGMPSYSPSSDYNILMGSWWYTTDSLGRDGWGNVRGNSGAGFMQIYNTGASTVETSSYGFSGFNGTVWTDFNFSLSGKNATYSNAYSRFWVDNYTGGGSDKVIFHDYSISLTASGLHGVQTGGIIEANDHPTSVSGTFTALFENVSTTETGNNGFYKVALTLDMNNWAYENRTELTNKDGFSPSLFVAKAPSTVPDGGTTVALTGLALGLMALYRQKRS